MIHAYEGDKSKLGNAEKFYLLLSQLPGYKIRVEGMLLKVIVSLEQELGTLLNTYIQRT
jgi:hypothetical protein